MTWRLGHRPALDGLRGVAILLVLLCHFDNPATNRFTSAGIMGVTVFFTLSGFLITSLLLDEHDRSGRVCLPAFYRRRAARLLPALLAMLLAVVVMQRYFDLAVGVGAFCSTVFYVANWWAIAHPGLTALSHTWSLAIEEQFYLVWPLALVAAIRRGRRAVLAVAAAGSLVSFGLLGVGWVEHWAVVGQRSDTRASSLLVGCALAAWMHGRPEQRSRSALAAVLLTALVPLTLSTGPVADSLMVTVPLVTAAIIWATAQGSGSRLLSAGWLRWVGRRSYGIYVWHFPILILGFEVVPVADWQVRSTVLPGLTFLAAVASWRFIEQPFLKRRSHEVSTQVRADPAVAEPVIG